MYLDDFYDLCFKKSENYENLGRRNRFNLWICGKDFTFN